MKKNHVLLKSFYAILFLCSLFVCSGCPANVVIPDGFLFPFENNGKICSFSADGNLNPTLNTYSFSGIRDDFTQSSVCASQRKGCILAWNKSTQYLYYISESQTISSKIKLRGSSAYVGKNFILVQSNTFTQGKGFSFTLYFIKYTSNGKKIEVSKVWSGGIDCFVSDCFFTADGICIAGGTQNNAASNVFYITKNGCHECFSTDKRSDFLRLINTGDSVYAFRSSRDKSAVDSVIYRFTLDNYIEGNDPNSNITVSAPDGFDCFFGYGFEMNSMLVLPASINGVVSFICYDYKNAQVKAVIPDATGCNFVLGQTEQGTWYIAKDPLLEGSYYGIALFTGTECKKILNF